MNKETSIAAVSSLWLRHQDAAEHYQKAQELAKDQGMKEWFESLAAYRSQLAEACRDFLESLPPIPSTPNRKIVSGASERWSDLKEALLLNNRTKVTSICRDSELEDYNALKESLNIHGLPVGVEDFLDRQGKVMLDVQPKVERMNVIPALSKNSFQTK